MTTRTRWVFLAAGLVLAVSACGGSGSSASSKADTPHVTKASTTTTKPLKVPTTEELKPALLTVQDLPTGWGDVPTAPGSTDTNPTGGPCHGPNFYARLDSAHVVGSRVTRSFSQNPSFGPYLYVDLASFSTASDAEAFMTSTRVVNSACTEYTTPAPGTPNGVEKITMGGLSFPKLGDDTLAVRQTTDSGGGSAFTLDWIYVRSGNLIIAVGQGASSPDASLLASKASLQLDRVRGLSG